MKKIFNILIVTFISVTALFAFSKVYAEGGGGSSFGVKLGACIYSYDGGEISITATETNNKIKLKPSTTLSVINTYTSDLDSQKFKKYNQLSCPNIYVKKETTKSSMSGVVIYNNYLYLSTESKDGYDQTTFLRAEYNSCYQISEFQSKYDLDALLSEYKTISSRTNDSYSIVKISGDNATIATIDEKIECSELKKYLNHYYNVLNPSHEVGGELKTELVILSKKLQKAKEEINSEHGKICKNDAYFDYYSKIDDTQKAVDSLYRAAIYQSDIIDKRIRNNQCTDIDEGALRKSLTADTTEIEKYKKQAMLVGAEFEFKTGCAIIGGELKNFLNTVLFYIRLVAIVLAIILSLLDYIKAATASDEKPMSAANKRFITRLILVIVLFLLPAILTFMLNVLNINQVNGDSIKCLEVEK